MSDVGVPPPLGLMQEEEIEVQIDGSHDDAQVFSRELSSTHRKLPLADRSRANCGAEIGYPIPIDAFLLSDAYLFNNINDFFLMIAGDSDCEHAA